MIIVKETNTTTWLQGQIVDDNLEFTLVELSRASGATEDELTLWVAEGVCEPVGTQPEEWRFSGTALRRARTAQRLTHGLQINAPGVALALDLLDEIAALRARVKRR
ncbi:chaperone modulator CbpM [Paraburkholderia sp. BCC1884]|uniref:chaperone modulator CbpM n=1 Tax=Paraburkholderia sp. BCC1884 TaxID=2562668 RepID=UPI0011842F57